MAASTRAFVIILAMAWSLVSTGGIARADTLLVESLNAAQPSIAERPKRGSSMARVEAQFGPPSSRSGAIGQPPITRWDYAAFTVYFEYDHVVHAIGR